LDGAISPTGSDIEMEEKEEGDAPAVNSEDESPEQMTVDKPSDSEDDASDRMPLQLARYHGPYKLFVIMYHRPLWQG